MTDKSQEAKAEEPSMQAFITLANSLGQVTEELRLMGIENRALRRKLQKAEEQLADKTAPATAQSEKR